jgi:uncharacterized BrkB/YihY/UPF0761 family membrane protein
LLWAIYSANVFLLGAEFAEIFAETRGATVRPHDYATRIGAGSAIDHGGVSNSDGR